MGTWSTYKKIHEISETHMHFFEQTFSVNVWSTDKHFENWHESPEKKVNHKHEVK